MRILNRRHFLATSLAAAPSDTVRIGIIGVGGRGNALMTQELTRVPNARLTHVCDVDQARLEKAQANAAKAGCVISRALAVPVTMEATLV